MLDYWNDIPNDEKPLYVVFPDKCKYQLHTDFKYYPVSESPKGARRRATASKAESGGADVISRGGK